MAYEVLLDHLPLLTSCYLLCKQKPLRDCIANLRLHFCWSSSPDLAHKHLYHTVHVYSAWFGVSADVRQHRTVTCATGEKLEFHSVELVK